MERSHRNVPTLQARSVSKRRVPSVRTPCSLPLPVPLCQALRVNFVCRLSSRREIIWAKWVAFQGSIFTLIFNPVYQSQYRLPYCYCFCKLSRHACRVAPQWDMVAGFGAGARVATRKFSALYFWAIVERSPFVHVCHFNSKELSCHQHDILMRKL